MDLKFLFLGVLIHYYYDLVMSSTETVTYISTEHPVVSWFDPTVYKNITLNSRRVNRHDPRYYVDLYVHSLVVIGNNVKLDFYFYQFLTNRYRPSFIEMHFRFCDMVGSDSFFGAAMKQALHNITCPFTPGVYDLRNMSIAFVPKGFPFTKGRIYCNLTLERGGITKPIGSGFIDMEIKVAKINLKKKNQKYN